MKIVNKLLLNAVNEPEISVLNVEEIYFSIQKMKITAMCVRKASLSLLRLQNLALQK